MPEALATLAPEAMAALTHSHGVTPLLRRINGEPPEPDQLNRALSQLAETVRLARLFEAAGIRLLALKGSLLALRLYGDVALRASGDIDLLVAPDDVPAAVTLLETAGYGNRQPQIPLTGHRWKVFARHRHELKMVRHNLKVEVHWRLAPDVRLLPLAFDDLWARRYYQVVGGTAIATLGEEDLALHLIVHVTREFWTRLKWVDDLVRLFAPLDAATTERLVARFAEVGLDRPLAIGYGLLWNLFGLPLPPAIVAILTKDPKARAMLARLMIRYRVGPNVARPSEMERMHDELNLRPGWRHHVAIARHYAFDAELFMQLHQKFPGLPPELYYVTRPPLYHRAWDLAGYDPTKHHRGLSDRADRQMPVQR